MAEELKIVIEADVSQAQQALAGIQDSANKTATSLKNVAPAANSAFAATAQQAKVVQLSVSSLGRTIDDLKQKVAGKQALISTERDITNIARLNKEIQALQAEIQRVQNIGKSGFNELGQASTEATDKLVGGFSNAFGAIRRLAFILPGIGIAGIFDAAFHGLQTFVDAIASSNLGVNKFKELTSAIEASKDEFVKASVTVASLREEIQLAKDGFISKDDVVKKYNETLGKTTGLVNNITEAETALNKNADAYIRFTLLKAAANVALGKSAELAFEAALQNQKDLERISKITVDKEGIGEFIKSGEENLRKAEQESFQKRISSLKNIADNFLKESATIAKAFNFNFFDENKQKSAVKSLDEVQQKLIQLAKEAEKVFNVPLTLKFDDTDLSPEKLRKAILVLKGIQDFTIKARVDIVLPDIKELPKEEVEKFFKNVPSALQDAVDKGIIDAQGRELKIDLGPFSKEIQAEIDKFNQAGLTIPVTFDLKDADLLIKLRDAFPIEQIQKNVDELKKSLGTEDTFQGFIRDLIKLGDEGQKAFDATAKAALDAGDSITEALRKAGDAQNQIGGLTKEAGEAALVLQQTLAPAFESLFSAILEGQAPLDAFFKSLIRGIDQLIAKLIAAALEALILSTITGGIGGFGGIFKALLGFAKGGDPAPDKPFIAGEKGWELIVPKTSMHVFTHEQSKSILSSSVKDHESIKEYLIASRISQQLKEHFSTAFKSIETTVKTISASHDKLIAYSYKLHESVKETNNSFASISNTIEKISERPSATIGTQSSYHEKSFIEIVKNLTSTGTDKTSFASSLNETSNTLSTASEKIASSFKAIDRLHESVTNNLSTSINKLHEKINISDRSVTIERIINNNFYSSEVKDSFKSMSLTDIQRTFHIPAFAQGGAVFGPTLAILGEGFGVSRSNPEFVGTASQLKGIQGGQFDINVSVDGELSFSMGKLALALNREVRSQLRTSGKNPF